MEAWGADWQNVVVGELLERRAPSARRPAVAHARHDRDGEPLEIVCGATNIAAGQRVPVALPGAVLPGDRRIERTEKMGVVSNGMLCSGDELNLTSDADGILILPPDAPLGVAAGGPVRRRRARCRREAEPRRRAEHGRPGPRGVGRDRSASPVPGDRPGRDRAAHRGAPDGRGRGAGAVHPLRRPLGRGRHGQAVAGSGPDALLAAGQRPVSNVVDVSNYVMLELGKPIHTFDAAAVHDGRIVVRLAGRASASRRSTTSGPRAQPGHAADRRLSRSTRYRRGHGRGDLGDLR